jgi:asparagine synthase (glutamine-hydrolysing)
MYELLAQVRPILYDAGMWDRLGEHNPYDDLDLTTDRIARWHPLNRSLYVGYKVMLAGLLMISKGDRIAMHSSIEARYPFLDEDVVAFCAQVAPEYKLRGLTEKWLLRRVAARTLPPQIADRPKTMFRASLAQTFLGPHRPPGSTSSSPPSRSARPATSTRPPSPGNGPRRCAGRGSPPAASSTTWR